MIDKLRASWNNSEELSNLLLDIFDRQMELAGLIASQEVSYSSAFVSEREESIKGTDALARARAKSIVGASGTMYDYEFQALTNLIPIVISRISQLQASQSENPKPL